MTAPGKHTPGPWLLLETEDGHEIRMGDAIASPSDHETHNLLIYDHGVEVDDENGQPNEQFAQAEANARLIAAAPDMLRALGVLLAKWEGDDWVNDQEEMAGLTRAAISKATGDAK